MHTLPYLPDKITSEIFATRCGRRPAPANDAIDPRAETAMASLAGPRSIRPIAA